MEGKPYKTQAKARCKPKVKKKLEKCLDFDHAEWRKKNTLDTKVLDWKIGQQIKKNTYFVAEYKS